MPFVSEAQRRKFAALVAAGQLPQKTFDEWNAATPKDLPDRVKRVKPVKALTGLHPVRPVSRAALHPVHALRPLHSPFEPKKKR